MHRKQHDPSSTFSYSRGADPPILTSLSKNIHMKTIRSLLLLLLLLSSSFLFYLTHITKTTTINTQKVENNLFLCGFGGSVNAYDLRDKDRSNPVWKGNPFSTEQQAHVELVKLHRTLSEVLRGLEISKQKRKMPETKSKESDAVFEEEEEAREYLDEGEEDRNDFAASQFYSNEYFKPEEQDETATFPSDNDHDASIILITHCGPDSTGIAKGKAEW